MKYPAMAAAICTLLAGAAQAEPLRLDDRQLDGLTAGLRIFGDIIQTGQNGNYGILNTGITMSAS